LKTISFGNQSFGVRSIQLGLTAISWAEIVEACAVRVIAMNQIAEEEDL